MKNKTLILIITGAIGVLLGILTNQFIPRTPKNCAVIGQQYLEMAKGQYNVTDYGSDRWNQLIERETALTNLCYEKLEFETPKGGEKE